MWKNHLYIVFAIDHYNPLGVIRSLGENGITPIYISIKGKNTIASYSKYISQCHFVDSVEDGYKLLIEKYGDTCSETGLKPYIFCSDDRTIGFIDQHYNELIDRFIFFNAGIKNRINYFMNKSNILKLAKKYGLNVLDSEVCKKGELPLNLSYPIITKSISPNVGGWKSDVHICFNEEELLKAYESIDASVVLVQKYIDKKNEYCMEGFSVCKGNESLISIVSTYNYLLPDYYSPYMTCTNMDDDFLKNALGSMIKEIGFEGIFEIEFLIDQDEKFYFSEINFRNSTWSYASTKAGMPLPILWAEGMAKNHIKHDAYNKVKDNFKAMVEPIDFEKRVKTNKISLARWLIDFKEASCGYYYSADDVEPWINCINNWSKLG